MKAKQHSRMVNGKVVIITSAKGYSKQVAHEKCPKFALKIEQTVLATITHYHINLEHASNMRGVF